MPPEALSTARFQRDFALSVRLCGGRNPGSRNRHRLGWANLPTIALAVGLAFFFGYAFTMVPLLRAGLAFGAVLKLALATDTISILIMEIVDNGIMLLIPGAMDAGLGSGLFWGSLAVALLIAGAFAFPVNRWLIARGKKHAVVHAHHHH